jgi:Meiotically up-regulated gene 113
MNFRDFFKDFEKRKTEIEQQEDALKADYKKFIEENRKEIKMYIPPKDSVVKYIGVPKVSHNNKEWKFLKIVDGRIISTHDYGNYIPKIGVVPLDEDFNVILNYTERVEICDFAIIDQQTQKLADSVGYVYLLNAVETDIYKIGFSKNVIKRVNSLKSSSPIDISIYKIYKCYKAYYVEQELHKLFIDKRVNNEWFRLDAQDLNKADGFIRDFKISNSINGDVITAQSGNGFFFHSYETEKREIRNEFEKLKEDFINKHKKASIGEKIIDLAGHICIVESISFYDKLDSKTKKFYLKYKSRKILKSGEKSKSASPFTFLKESALNVFVSDKSYFANKQMLNNQYVKLRKEVAEELSLFKKGDLATDISGTKYIVETVEFHDSFDWSCQSFFTYTGRRVLSDGQLSEIFPLPQSIEHIE